MFFFWRISFLLSQDILFFSFLAFARPVVGFCLNVMHSNFMAFVPYVPWYRRTPKPLQLGYGVFPCTLGF